MNEWDILKYLLNMHEINKLYCWICQPYRPPTIPILIEYSTRDNVCTLQPMFVLWIEITMMVIIVLFAYVSRGLLAVS